MLSAVCRGVNGYLFGDAGGRHWTRVGRLVCGDGHQMDEEVRRMCGERYATMLEICPWVSVPREVPLQLNGESFNRMLGILPRRTLDCWVAVCKHTSPCIALAHGCFNGTCTVVESDDDDKDDYYVANSSDVLKKLNVSLKNLRDTYKTSNATWNMLHRKNNMSVDDSMRCSESYTRELEDALKSVGSDETSVVSNIFKSKDNDEAREDLKLARCTQVDGWLPFENALLQDVIKVHNSVIALVCSGQILFVSASEKNFLRTIQIELRGYRPDMQICFAPGEIWLLHYHHRCIRYFGPHASRIRSHVPSERMMQGM